jgi:hypothetical protein
MSALKSLPAHTPAEVLDISPEFLEIANCFLQNQDIIQVADLLEIPVSLVTQTLAHKQVKAYVDNVFMNLGFNNQFKMRAAMDAVLKTKFREMEEADVGSSKDVIEIMALSHKMSMDYLAAQMALEKIQSANVKNQVNVQINENGSDGTKYGTLIQKLINLDAK